MVRLLCYSRARLSSGHTHPVPSAPTTGTKHKASLNWQTAFRWRGTGRTRTGQAATLLLKESRKRRDGGARTLKGVKTQHDFKPEDIP